MLTTTLNEQLTRVGPGTPMGELMRRYWHPIAASAELDNNPFRTKEVRLLGEDLVLFRDCWGKLGLIERYCSHRRVNLAIGVVERDGLRCQYHGWKFDHTGRCVEQPFEDTTHGNTNPRFKEHCSLAGYEVREVAGLVWGYLGPQPAAAFPLWGPLAWDNVVRDIVITDLPCNWLQCQENSLDPVHVEWLHVYYGDYVRQALGQPRQILGQGTFRHRKIGFEPFEHGILKRRVLEGYTEEDDDWKHGHPILFPHTLFVGDSFRGLFQFRVPVDDSHTYHVSLYVYRPAPGARAPRQEQVPYRVATVRASDGRWLVDYTFTQDYAAWITQGPIAQRDKEKLGESDRGIILFRGMLREQLRVLEDGGRPMNVFPVGEMTAPLPLPLEGVKFGQKKPPPYAPQEPGESADKDLILATLATWERAVPSASLAEPEVALT